MTDVSTAESITRRKRGLQLQREGNTSNLAAAKVVVLSTFSVDLISPLITEALARAGLFATVQVGEFGQMDQAMLDPDSVLYRQRPDIVILIPAVEDMLAALFARPAHFTADAARTLAESQAAALRRSVEVLFDRLPATTCYVVTFGPESAPSEYVLDPSAPERSQEAVDLLLARIRALRQVSSKLVVVDWEWHARGEGTRAFRDRRLWYLARMRVNPAGLAAMADLVATHVDAARGKPHKVVAVDLDNTLWGGVVGEVGVQGIELGDEGLGFAYRDFQRELVKLRDTGMLLVAVSKNNRSDVLEALALHRSMLLKAEDFAGMRINWQDKATNVRELAEELNLGVDSFVFLDDNPIERSWLRHALPGVCVPDLPADPAERPSFLRQLPALRRIALTDADRSRAEAYGVQAQRTALQSTASSFEEFLASLEQEVTIEPLQMHSIARAAQMCQRTNQFNLTTQRYSAAELERMVLSSDTEAYVLAVKDRFGDNGITGLGILRMDGDTAEVDSLLLSCRVLGRRIENAFLHVLAERAKERGMRRIKGRYVPTPKNAQVATFYAQHGFESVGEGVFSLDLDRQGFAAPSHIAIKVVMNV